MIVPVLAVMHLIAVQQPSLSLPDRRLVPGSSVELTGARLPAGRVVLLLAGDRDSAQLAAITVPASGNLSQTIVIPAALRPGAYRLLALTGGRTATSLDVAVLEDSTSAAASRSASGAAGDTAAAVGPAAVETVEGEDESTAAFGYDWPRLHAALNDFPAALLVFALLFELGAIATGRESLRGAGFWSLIAGTAGMGAAAVAGLMAENSAAHDDVAHAVMTRHKTIAVVSFAVFLVLLLWRLLRRKVERRPERLAWSGLAAVAVALLIYASQLGGSLVFDHALGVPSPTLRAVLERRGDMPMDMADSSGADSTARANPVRPHRDRPGTAPHAH